MSALDAGPEGRDQCVLVDLRHLHQRLHARRVENRIAGADANPYLAIAASLAAGLAGMDERLDAFAPIADNGYNQTAINGLKQLKDEFKDILDQTTPTPIQLQAIPAVLAGGDLLAGGDNRIVFAGIMQDRSLADPADQFVGLARHRRDDDDDVIAVLDLALDLPRRVLDAGKVGHRGAAEFHHENRHPSPFAKGISSRVLYADRAGGARGAWEPCRLTGSHQPP